MTPRVFRQLPATLRTFSTLHALVFLPMNVHVTVQVGPVWICLLTEHALVGIMSRVSVGVLHQPISRCELFIADGATM